MEEHFEKAFRYVLKNEGHYVNDKDDMGGETNYGISQNAHPDVDVKNITLEKVRQIYHDEYWLKSQCDKIENAYVVTKLLDVAVHCGVRGGARILQRALLAAGAKVVQDEIIGVKTVAACNTVDQNALLAAMKSEAAAYYRIVAIKQPSQEKFLNGWIQRAYKKIVL